MTLALCCILLALNIAFGSNAPSLGLGSKFDVFWSSKPFRLENKFDVFWSNLSLVAGSQRSGVV